MIESLPTYIVLIFIFTAGITVLTHCFKRSKTENDYNNEMNSKYATHLLKVFHTTSYDAKKVDDTLEARYPGYNHGTTATLQRYVAVANKRKRSLHELDTFEFIPSCQTKSTWEDFIQNAGKE